MTAYEELEVLKEAERRAAGYISKPFDIEELKTNYCRETAAIVHNRRLRPLLFAKYLVLIIDFSHIALLMTEPLRT